MRVTKELAQLMVDVQKARLSVVDAKDYETCKDAQQTLECLEAELHYKMLEAYGE